NVPPLNPPGSNCRAAGERAQASGAFATVDNRSAEPATNFVAHLLAELLAARRAFLFGDVEAVEHVEIIEDRVALAGHRQDTKQFPRGPGRAGDFPAPDGIAAAAGRKAAKLRHIGCAELPADGLAEVVAEFFQFGAGQGTSSFVRGIAGF